MKMHPLLALGLAFAPVSLAAEAPPAKVPAVTVPAVQARPLTADEQAALRCGAAFAIVAAQQARGDAAAAHYPPLAVRGREFFAQTGARLMDDAGLDEAGVRAAAEVEAGAVRAEGTAALMPFCLGLLDARVPARP